MPSKYEVKPVFVDVTSATRLRMQAVRRHDTAPEMAVRRLLHAMGYRFRLHRKDLPGSPDIVLPGHRKIILVHGCFWHGHERCKRAKSPTKNMETWRIKIEANQMRDAKNVVALRELGWGVLIVWECEVRDQEQLANRLRDFLLVR
ncbi:very short patch repair endonuclease [Ferribacterium limneticum]|uniref:very short patch repair endonuclease n=1 Tax=Ferribacterium limneticum TaxID=76259 RepID=UPI001CF86896|nr:DNA mismatch endonuclease Vsr [Ferribacterium limneticum]UCV21484.1 DNA mismatch endonuclease Vsr [Ferribacterium limneticum]